MWAIGCGEKKTKKPVIIREYQQQQKMFCPKLLREQQIKYFSYLERL